MSVTQDSAAVTPYEAYVYAYPHKTAYRALDPRPALRDVWAGEDRSSLFLYLHIPFCEMRCGFCNLFTRTGAPAELTESYLAALDRQARVVAGEISPASFGAAAFGGGTPTYLTAGELDTLCGIASRFADLSRTGFGVETSPATATADRLAVLKDRGATRVSIGVQSFVDAEAHAAGRPQKRAEAEAALGRIRAAGIDVLNIDLMYGIAGQTPASWRRSLEAALAWAPEEVYLYPLYVRPLTGLGRIASGRRDDGDPRPGLYQLGRDFLLSAGYEQVSMRMFRLPGGTSGSAGTGYCCQEDGMIGLGCGARSYTSSLHYSFEYAVEISRVRRIIDSYVSAPDRDFASAAVGFRLDGDEQRRRWFAQSLLQADGADTAAYRDRFGTDVREDFVAELSRFEAAGWAVSVDGRIRLTAEGLAWSDAIGPALFSRRVKALMEDYEAR